MTIIKIDAQENGAHANQTSDNLSIPEGWIAVPPELEAQAASYLPFIVLEIEEPQWVEPSTMTEQVWVEDEIITSNDENGGLVEETIPGYFKDVTREVEGYWTQPKLIGVSQGPIPEPEPLPEAGNAPDFVTYDELAAAIKEGVNEA